GASDAGPGDQVRPGWHFPPIGGRDAVAARVPRCAGPRGTHLDATAADGLASCPGRSAHFATKRPYLSRGYPGEGLRDLIHHVVPHAWGGLGEQPHRRI